LITGGARDIEVLRRRSQGKGPILRRGSSSKRCSHPFFRFVGFRGGIVLGDEGAHFLGGRDGAGADWQALGGRGAFSRDGGGHGEGRLHSSDFPWACTKLFNRRGRSAAGGGAYSTKARPPAYCGKRKKGPRPHAHGCLARSQTHDLRACTVVPPGFLVHFEGCRKSCWRGGAAARQGRAKPVVNGRRSAANNLQLAFSPPPTKGIYGQAQKRGP